MRDGQGSDSPVVLLTPEQAAEALGIGCWKLYDLLRRGRLRSIRIGSCRRIPTDALRAFVTELEDANGGSIDLRQVSPFATRSPRAGVDLEPVSVPG